MKNKFKIGDKIEVTSKSQHHPGQKGTIYSGIDNMFILVKVEDEKYKYAFKSKDKEGKYLQIDRRHLKVL